MNIYFNQYLSGNDSEPDEFGYHSVSHDSTNDLVIFKTNECHHIADAVFGKADAIAAARAILKHFGEVME